MNSRRVIFIEKTLLSRRSQTLPFKKDCILKCPDVGGKGKCFLDMRGISIIFDKGNYHFFGMAYPTFFECERSSSQNDPFIISFIIIISVIIFPKVGISLPLYR